MDTNSQEELNCSPFGTFKANGDYFGSDLEREPTPKLNIGITGDYNNNAARSRGNLGSFLTDESNNYVTSDLKTIFVDLIYKHKGFSVTSEYVYRNSNNKVAKFGYGKGITAACGYLLPSNVEFAARYTKIEPISSLSGIVPTSEYMIGISKYVRGHSLKIQSDYSYTVHPNDANFYMFRLQVEVAI